MGSCNWNFKPGITLLLVGLLFSIAHAAEHGSGAHEHEGVVCLVILNDEQDALIPQANLIALSATLVSDKAIATRQVSPAFQGVIRPPSTGPPSILA